MGEVTGLTPRELAGVRAWLEGFAGEMFAPMRRRDQRRWGECYEGHFSTGRSGPLFDRA